MSFTVPFAFPGKPDISTHLETLQAVIATALNIVQNRT
jgi:hypothetical protein